MFSSPLRRVLSAVLLVATFSVLPSTVEASRVDTTGNNDSTVSARFDGFRFLARLWEEFSHIWAADGARLDPNGHH